MDENKHADMTTTAPARPSNLLTSTQKTLALIEAMAAMGRRAGVSELARAVGSSRGTVHKQLSTLVASGWVEQHEDGRYGLALLAARVGNAALEQAGLGTKIQRVLEGVVEESGESVTIAALHGRETLIVQRAETAQVLNANVRVGTTIPLRSGASSHVLLAFATTPEQRDRWRAEGVDLPSEEHIATVRESGYATTQDDFLLGVTAVSVPLHHEFTLTTTALTMVGPKERVDVDSALTILSEARERLSALQ